MITKNLENLMYFKFLGEGRWYYTISNGEGRDTSSIYAGDYITHFMNVNSGTSPFLFGTGDRKTTKDDYNIQTPINTSNYSLISQTRTRKSARNEGYLIVGATYRANADLEISEVGLDIGYGGEYTTVLGARMSTTDTDENGNSVFSKLSVSSGAIFTVEMLIG